MAIEIRVPALGESVKEATVGKWFKQPGEAIKADEPLVELETDKVTVEVPAPSAGVMGEIKVAQGETVLVGALLGSIREGVGGTLSAVSAPKLAVAAPAPKAAAAPATVSAMPPAPAARRAIAETGVDAATIAGSGKRGQILKQDVMAALDHRAAPAAATTVPGAGGASMAMVAAPSTAPTSAPSVTVRSPIPLSDAEREERVRMTRLRQTIARRLKDAQNTAAMLTTFNDVDMSAIMKMRSEYKDLFEKRHGTRLGFMGFFVKACVQALKEVPAVNAEIDGTDIIFKNYYHIGVAVGTEKGLVVPVVRDAELKSLSEIEGTINDYGRKARDGKLTIEDMQGGTFTISNGGVYGSMMSTPILNAPQSGILGMHRIEERPVVRAGQIVIRPMMYLAMSYDHRIVDGKDAVTFLVRVKEGLEDPQRLILEL
jgi:2-oxoglutarate dehydrogenase E2 component (dihydrolipoamide succinyltransferase)